MYWYIRARVALTQRLRAIHPHRTRRYRVGSRLPQGLGPLASYRLGEITYPAETWVGQRVVEPSRTLCVGLNDHLRALDMLEQQELGKLARVVAAWAATFGGEVTEYGTLLRRQPSMLESEVHVVAFDHPEHGACAAVVIAGNETDLSESCFVYYAACPRESWGRFNDADLTCPRGHAWAYRDGQVIGPTSSGTAYGASADEIWGEGGMYARSKDVQGPTEYYTPCPMCAAPCTPTLPVVAL